MKNSISSLRTVCMQRRSIRLFLPYVGEISINDSNIEPLINAARVLQVNDVVELCSEYLIKRLHVSNCIGVRNFADAHGCLRLKDCANGFAMVGMQY